MSQVVKFLKISFISSAVSIGVESSVVEDDCIEDYCIGIGAFVGVGADCIGINDDGTAVVVGRVVVDNCIEDDFIGVVAVVGVGADCIGDDGIEITSIPAIFDSIFLNSVLNIVTSLM